MKKRVFLLLSLFLTIIGAKADEVAFSVPDFSIEPGETKEISLIMTSTSDDMKFNFNGEMILSEGLTFVATQAYDEDEEEYYDIYALRTDRLKASHSISENLKAPNDLSFLVSAGTKFVSFKAGEAILTFKVKAADDIVLGTGSVQLKGMSAAGEASVQLVSNPDYTATVTITKKVSVTAAPADEKQGTVTGGGSYDSGSKVTVTATAAAGYEFVNWTSGETVASTENPYEFTVTEDIKLTAHFQAITYNLTYDLANGALPGGKTNPATYTVETDDIVLVNPELTGYDFAGWTGTDLTEATKAVTIAKGSTGDRSYTATWTATKYAITYDLAGGKLADGDTNPASYTIESDAITLKNPTREGYTFAGWTGTDLTEASTAVTIAKGSMGARTYTATWTPITYTITYDLDGGAVATANPATYTIESEAITLVNPTKDGFDFAGWTGTGLTEATKNVTIAKGSTGDRTYTATWTPASGIKAIFSDSKTVNVYRVNGTLVGRDMTVDEVIQLKHGVYVVNGKKIAIK